MAAALTSAASAAPAAMEQIVKNIFKTTEPAVSAKAAESAIARTRPGAPVERARTELVILRALLISDN